MGIEDNKINKTQLGALARKTIAKGQFGRFTQEFSKDLHDKNLTEFQKDITAHMAAKTTQQNNLEK